MARNTTRVAPAASVAVEPTVAMKAAALFDRAKDSVIADVKKPADQSKTKQALGIGLIAGVAIGVWELAGN